MFNRREFIGTAGGVLAVAPSAGADKPAAPARKDYPPDQVNVDRLASFVIE